MLTFIQKFVLKDSTSNIFKLFETLSSNENMSPEKIDAYLEILLSGKVPKLLQNENDTDIEKLYAVHLVDTGSNRISIIKFLRTECDCDLAKAKSAATIGCVIAKNITKEKATFFKNNIEELGGKVTIFTEK